jgi:acetylornithine/N-succinyldiaminopimelate aminotransferase
VSAAAPQYESLAARFDTALMPTYGTPPAALVRGEGCVVWDADGNEYLDFIAGIAVSSLGHAHPAVVEAVSRQVATIAHTSNLFLHEPEVALAEKLVGLLGHEARVFFTNSGTEANEAAFKLVRRHAATVPGGTERTYVVAAENGFHGRTMGALALTGKAAIRDPFAPYGVDVRFVPFGDATALKEMVTDQCAGVFLEPALGEGGVVPAPPGYLAAAREVCDATGAVLVLDEIQSGIGRTGSWFAHQRDGIVPDVLTLAKGLGGGLPIGACVGIGRFGTVFAKGDHGSTFGGNPVACAAAAAVLRTIEDDKLLEHVATVGGQLASGVAALDHPLLAGVRGQGLWLAAVLTQPRAAQVQAAAQAAGFLVNAVQPDAVRLAPPLVVTSAQVQAVVDALPGILDAGTGSTRAKET